MAWLLREPLFAARRRRRITLAPFPAEWREHLRRRVPYFRSMPADLQLQLKKHIQVFLAEKPFIGCGGLVVIDEMRVTIAAQACLLILNRRNDYFAQLRQILVYPGAFVVDKLHTDAAGVQQDSRQVLAGESWSLGQVIVSWQDAIDGAAVTDDGRNVVIHEFAHQLDQANGRASAMAARAGETSTLGAGAGRRVCGLATTRARRPAFAAQRLRRQRSGRVFCGGVRGVLRATPVPRRRARVAVSRAERLLPRESAELVAGALPTTRY